MFPFNPFARDATHIKEDAFEDMVVDASKPIDIPLASTHVDEDTPY